MTAEETRKAAAIWADAMRAAANEPADGSVDAHYELARRRIVEEFPRLDADRVAEELERVREQTGRALRAPGGGGVGTVGMDCGECHRKTRPLPDGQTFDVVGIYPLMADRAEFDGGRRVPVLAESLELEAQARLVGGDEGSCLTCHTPHDTRGFEITEKDRVDNMGLWVNVIETDPGILHVQVKVKNADSGHRAPAGRPTSAYVTTVEAFQHGRPLSPRYGQRLPPHLRTDAYTLGSVFARHMVDTAGTVTTDLGDVADLKFDSRLLSGRFDGEDFVFDRFDGSPARVRVTLWYLPDYSTWKNASAIRRADKKDR